MFIKLFCENLSFSYCTNPVSSNDGFLYVLFVRYSIQCNQSNCIEILQYLSALRTVSRIPIYLLHELHPPNGTLIVSPVLGLPNLRIGGRGGPDPGL